MFPILFMGNICKSPFWGPFANLRNGEHLQITNLWEGNIWKSLEWGTFANLRFGGHLQVFGMGDICKSPFWGPFASLWYGEHLQISVLGAICKSPEWGTNANYRGTNAIHPFGWNCTTILCGKCTNQFPPVESVPIDLNGDWEDFFPLLNLYQ